MAAASSRSSRLEEFLKPLHIDIHVVRQLSRDFAETFRRLAAESSDQFLATPISESILRPAQGHDPGRYLAIDIGGTNLRVGFIELAGHTEAYAPASPSSPSTHLQNGTGPRLKRLHERNWPIQDVLKRANQESLFTWIGECIASTVQEGCEILNIPRDGILPMGVTFSFPMEQESLSVAKLMPMGKGFAITSIDDLGSQLLAGYEKARTADLPGIRIAAIVNDAVATLVSFIYEFRTKPNQKAVMGLICGTGCNATMLLPLSSLHLNKRPKKVNVLQGQVEDDVRVAVNTEWSIKGAAPPLRNLGLISAWDDELSAAVESPGFQPLEYMTAGRYLGELGRIMLVDYMTKILGLSQDTFPAKLMRQFDPHNTTFLSHYRPGRDKSLLAMLEEEFSTASEDSSLQWTEEIADALYHIAKAIEVRGAGIIAAAIVGLLTFAGEMPSKEAAADEAVDLAVGYTGGCITNFQDYLVDCQNFLDEVVKLDYSSSTVPFRITLHPCHDGGIKGAGILVPTAMASQKVEGELIEAQGEGNISISDDTIPNQRARLPRS